MVEMEDGSTKEMIGSLDPDCEVGDVVQQAYDNSRFLCEQVCFTFTFLSFKVEIIVCCQLKN
jgi:hypothetical protein